MALEYFQLFGIPVTLYPDTKSLHKKFIELSRAYHPDYHAQSDSDTQNEMLDKSAMLNRAWRIFQDQDATVRYVLMEKGVMEEEEKYQLSPDFLMEVMAINEEVMDLEPGQPDKVELIKQMIDAQSIEIYEPVADIVEHYKEDTVTETQLLQVKDWYYKKKYLDRISRELGEK